MAISIDGDNIVEVRSNKFLAMTKSGREYDFSQIKEATGIDLGSIIKNNF